MEKSLETAVINAIDPVLSGSHTRIDSETANFKIACYKFQQVVRLDIRPKKKDKA